MPGFDFDLFVIGAGSGGVRAARKAAEAGARVAIAEEGAFGGTCVNRGCVPKKLFVYAAQFGEHFADAEGFGWSLSEPARFDWQTLRANKDREIGRLEGLYRTNLERSGATIFAERAVFEDAHTLRLTSGRTVSAETILVAVGGRANRHESLPGHELAITSDEAFHLDRLPERVLVVGGGYIAVEFAGIFHGLGVDTTIVYRGREILQHFDMDARRLVHAEYENKGIRIRCGHVFERLERHGGAIRATLAGGETLDTDLVMLAVGRLPNTDGLGLERAGVETNHRGGIPVDRFSRTNLPHIYAIGDVTDRVALTPVAIHEAMCFVDTVFRGRPTAPDHDTIPTAVFSQPELAGVGLSEDEAVRRFPAIDIYKAVFRPMRNTLAGRSERMLVKLVVDADTDVVLGAHAVGPDAGELAQCLGIAVKARLTKAQFDATMAVHPTAAEEFVTMYTPTSQHRRAAEAAA